MNPAGTLLSIFLMLLALPSLHAQTAGDPNGLQEQRGDSIPTPADSTFRPAVPVPTSTDTVPATAGSLQNNDVIPAVDIRRHRLFAGIMAGSLTNRDEAGSPMTYWGIGFPFLLGYGYTGSSDRHRLLFGYRKTGINAPTLTSALTTARGSEQGTRVEHTVDYSLRQLSYRYSTTLAISDDERLRWLGGVLWDNILFFRYYTYAERPLFDREQSIGSWEGIFSLNLSLEGEYVLDDRSRISAELHAPFVAFLFRPRYSIQDDELIRISFDNFSQLNNGRSRIVTQGELLQLGGGIGYGYSLAENVDIRLDYSFIYSRIEYPRTSATVENGLAVTVGYWL